MSEEHKPRSECIERMMSIESSVSLLEKDVKSNKEDIEILNKKVDTMETDTKENHKDEIKAYKQKFFWIITAGISLFMSGIGFFVKELIKKFIQQ